MLRTLDLIWTCLFLFGACTVHTYKPSVNIEAPNDLDETGEPSRNLLDEEQKAAMEKDELSKLSEEEQQRRRYETEAEENLPLTTILWSGTFLWMYLLVVCHMYYGYYISNEYKQYGFTAGIDDRSLSLIGSCAALFNGCFKIFWASLLDCFNFKPVYTIVLVIAISMQIAIHWTVNNTYLYFVTICLAFMCDGSMTSMLPVVTNRVFGLKRGPSVYGYMFSTFGVAAMTGTLLVNTLQEPIGYTGMLLIGLCTGTIAAIITFFLTFQRVSYAEIAEKAGFDFDLLLELKN